MIASLLAWLPPLLAVISLTGAVGEKLRARVYFDANNVKVGDPLTLTIDLVGEADFASFHPPALAREVDARDWKVDDASARTDTYRDARRLTYRVRPMREGVLWFPALEFAYSGRDGALRTVRGNAVPVHARAMAGVVVEGMGQDELQLPGVDDLILEPPAALSDDEIFAWRKACANPTADAFAAFDFPAARLNEARMATLGGDPQRSLKVYSRLEWQTGQTPEIERGIIAARARLTNDPLAELPVWRQVGRPILRFPLWPRVGIVVGGLVALVAVLKLLGSVIRRLAAVALVAALVLPAAARAAESDDPFAAIEEQMEAARRQMDRMMQQTMMGGGFSMSLGGVEESPAEVLVTIRPDRETVKVGEPFELLVELETPRRSTLEQLRVNPQPAYGLKFLGEGRNLPDGKCDNASNVVRRVALPVRYDVPFKGEFVLGVSGMIRGKRELGSGNRKVSFSFSNSFAADSAPITLDIQPLDPANQPAGFAGFIADSATLTERCDSLTVGTNDIIQITYRLEHDGYLSEDYLPPGVAFDLGTGRDRRGRSVVEWRRFLVADGTPATPVVELVYYQPQTSSYQTLKGGGTPITYAKAEE